MQKYIYLMQLPCVIMLDNIFFLPEFLLYKKTCASNHEQGGWIYKFIKCNLIDNVFFTKIREI